MRKLRKVIFLDIDGVLPPYFPKCPSIEGNRFQEIISEIFFQLL